MKEYYFVEGCYSVSQILTITSSESFIDKDIYLGTINLMIRILDLIHKFELMLNCAIK